MKGVYTTLPTDVIEILDRIAADEGRTRAATVRHILTATVKKESKNGKKGK